jgi:glycosyltransferase involved in cell wall biosynthesis
MYVVLFKRGVVSMADNSGRKKIAFLTSIDPLDKRSWSGICYQMARSLQKYCGDVTCIGPASVPEKRREQSFSSRGKMWLKKVARRYFVYDYHILVAKNFAAHANRRFAQEHFDVIVAPASLTQVAFLELQTDIPVVVVEDGTFALLLNYYPQYTNLLARSVHQMHAITERGISKASALIYSSAWAAQSAIKDYHAASQRVHVVPMGANFDDPPDREIVRRKKKSAICKLLFVGVDWQRKGGEIAFETLLALHQMKIPAELIVCGCVPPKHFIHPAMKVIPYLNKNDPAQYNYMVQLYLEANFLLLPTRNECFGIVFCEANAFGLPAITTQTGGVPEVVRNDENGFVLPLEAQGDAYARLIASIYNDEARYAQLVLSSRAAYDERLNWDSWGITVNNIISSILYPAIVLDDLNRPPVV